MCFLSAVAPKTPKALQRSALRSRAAAAASVIASVSATGIATGTANAEGPAPGAALPGAPRAHRVPPELFYLEALEEVASPASAAAMSL